MKNYLSSLELKVEVIIKMRSEGILSYVYAYNAVEAIKNNLIQLIHVTPIACGVHDMMFATISKITKQQLQLQD